MKRRDFLRMSAAGAALALGPRRLRAQPVTRRPLNLLFIWTDQQRPDTMGFFGNPHVRTPNLDALARQSAVFRNTRVVHPVCTPSRGSILSGRWPHQTGVTANNVPLPVTVPLLPELLVRRDDYATAYMGKWHLGDEVFAQHGFREWVSTEDQYERFYSAGRDRTTRSAYHHHLVSHGFKPDQPNGTFKRATTCAMPFEHTKPEFLARCTVDFLQRYRDQPFVLSVNYLEPHPPYLSVLRGEYDAGQCPVPQTFGAELGLDMPLFYRARQASDRRTLRDRARLQDINAHYWGLTEQVDRSVGRILRALEATGQADNTIVVFTSDHGDMMGSHGMIGKSVMFEDSVRVPFMVKAPRLRSQVNDQPVSQIDFLPTVLDLMGTPGQEGQAGQSLRPLLAGEGVLPRSVFMEWSPNPKGRGEGEDGAGRLPGVSGGQIEAVSNQSVRTVVSPNGLKLSLRDCDLGTLFDLTRDPTESTNLFGRREYRERRLSLEKEIFAWQQRTGDALQLARS